MGIGIISRHGIELELETKRLVVLDVDHFPIVRHWYIVHRKDKRPSTAAQEFERFLLEESQNAMQTKSILGKKSAGISAKGTRA
jgi:DNA-binding transcriptional LysR family regulator